MFKNIDPSNKSIKPFKAYKSFVLTNNDSGSGHFVLKAASGSHFNFNTGSAASQSFGNYVQSASAFEYGTFYDLPNWHTINQLYYKRSSEPYGNFGSNDPKKINRELNSTAKVFSIPRQLFGEQIKPESVKLSATADGQTFDIRDDGAGNLFDFAHSASFAAFKSSSFDRSQGVQSNGSGSEVGNVFYEHGQVVITDTGSYVNVGIGTGHTLEYQATTTLYEHEYVVDATPSEFNLSTNLSATFERSGSISVAEGSVSMSRFFPPGDQPTGMGTGSLKPFYNAASKVASYTTHSEFQPYVSTIGLYNDNNELMAIGKLSKAVRLSKDANTSIVVRFDV